MPPKDKTQKAESVMAILNIQFTLDDPVYLCVVDPIRDSQT